MVKKNYFIQIIFNVVGSSFVFTLKNLLGIQLVHQLRLNCYFRVY